VCCVVLCLLCVRVNPCGLFLFLLLTPLPLPGLTLALTLAVNRGGARLLLAGDTTFEDGLGIIHYCRLGDLLRVVCFLYSHPYLLQVGSASGLTNPVSQLLRRFASGQYKVSAPAAVTE